ncbi:hypothetical protein AB9Q10_46050 [Streptomyces krungchingensis]|uniref:hypothetical protein n=1 Tax=Streptomyces krungchingensis TaxID=1565034 RepID=UPI003CE940F1
MDLDILYARENSLARAFPPNLVGRFSQLWAWAIQHPLAGAMKSAIAEDAVSFLLGVRQVEDVAAVESLSPGRWFYYTGPATFKWDSKRETGSVRINDPKLKGMVAEPLRGECMLTDTSWTNLKGRAANTFIMGRVEAPDRYDVYAAGHVNLFHGGGRVNKTFKMTGHLIRSGIPENNFGNLSAFVGHLIEQFGETLRLRRGWSLVGDGSSVSEKDCQTLFGIVATHAVETILVDRELETGLGPVDFILSGLGERHAIEFKVHKGRFAEIRHGLEVQLPTYLAAKKLDRGWFVVVHSGQPGPDSDVDSLRQRLISLNGNAAIEVRVLDGRPQVSASRRSEAI